MKKNFIYLTALSIAAISFIACKKDSTTNLSNNTTSITVRGNVYTEASGTAFPFQYANGQAILATGGVSADGKKSIILLGFWGSSKPAAGVYHVIATTPTAANQVVITVTDSASVSQQGIFTSTGTDNVSATVSVDGSGKVSVSLPVTQVSGTNFNNTDPNNTVTTTVSTTISGTVKEQ